VTELGSAAVAIRGGMVPLENLGCGIGRRQLEVSWVPLSSSLSLTGFRGASEEASRDRRATKIGHQCGHWLGP
jgi:hypothetical protein